MDILRDIPMAATFDPMAWKHVQAMLMVDVPHPEKALLMVLASVRQLENLRGPA